MESEWIRELESADVARRRAAAEQLLRLGAGASEGGVALVRAVLDEDEEVRELVMGALEDLGAPPNSSREELIALSGHAEADVAYWAVTLLGRLGSEAEVAVPALISAMGPDRPRVVRQRAAWALGEIGPGAKSAVAVLQAASEETGDPRLARLAGQALERIS